MGTFDFQSLKFPPNKTQLFTLHKMFRSRFKIHKIKPNLKINMAMS